MGGLTNSGFQSMFAGHRDFNLGFVLHPAFQQRNLKTNISPDQQEEIWVI